MHSVKTYKRHAGIIGLPMCVSGPHELRLYQMSSLMLNASDMQCLWLQGNQVDIVIHHLLGVHLVAVNNSASVLFICNGQP